MSGVAPVTMLLINVFLPLAIAATMIGLGLELAIGDFRRVVQFPKAVGLGLFLKFLFLPLTGFLLCLLFRLSANLSIGLMIVAASPSSVMAILYSHLFRGDVAFSVTLTAIDNVLSAIVITVVVSLAIAYFGGETQTLGMQLAETVKVFALIVVPIIIGMAARVRWPGLAGRMDRPIRLFSFLLLVTVVVFAIAQEHQRILSALGSLGAVAVSFNVLNLVFAIFASRLLKLSREQSLSMAMTMSVLGTTIAITVALSVLHNVETALPAAVYTISMYATAAVFGFGMKFRARPTNA